MLLDWEKAFDKVSQSKMIRSIRRLGIPEKIINMIKAIFLALNYTSTDKDVTTTPRIQKQESDKDAHCPPTFFHVDDRHHARCGNLTNRTRIRNHTQGPTTQTSEWITVLRR